MTDALSRSSLAVIKFNSTNDTNTDPVNSSLLARSVEGLFHGSSGKEEAEAGMQGDIMLNSSLQEFRSEFPGTTPQIGEHINQFHKMFEKMLKLLGKVFFRVMNTSS